MQTTENREIKKLDKRMAKLQKRSQWLTDEEGKIRESLSFENSYQQDNGEIDMARAQALVKNLKAHIKLTAEINAIQSVRQALEEAMDREEASKPENQAEAVDDREAQAIEADSARDTK